MAFSIRKLLEYRRRLEPATESRPAPPPDAPMQRMAETLRRMESGEPVDTETLYEDLMEAVSRLKDRSDGSFGGTGLDTSAESGTLWQILQLIRKASTTRRGRLKEYDEMSKDSVVQAALELMADDATQMNHEHQRSFWVKSKDASLEKELNAFLTDVVELEKRVWLWAYEIVKNGELFLQTFHADVMESQDKEGEKLEPAVYFEEVSRPETVANVVQRGKTIGFYQEGAEDAELLSDKEFIHFIADRKRYRETLTIPIPPKAEGEEAKTVTYTIKYGTSFLEGAKPAYQVVRVLDDVLILSRFSRSALVRLLQVNVGSAGRMETLKIINEIKNAFKSKESISPNRYSSDLNPVPIGDNIYIPTRNGKGEVQVEEYGGNVDVKSLTDVEMFMNKLFGALGVPKAFLGFEEHLPGGIGNTSLTRLDIRYARRIKRLVAALREGIRDLCNYYLEVKNRKDKLNAFEIVSNPINDAEESDRVNDIATKVQAADGIVNILSQLEGSLEYVDKPELLKYVFTSLLSLDISAFMLSDAEIQKIEKAKAKEKEAQDKGEEDAGGNGKKSPFGGGSPFANRL